MYLFLCIFQLTVVALARNYFCSVCCDSANCLFTFWFKEAEVKKSILREKSEGETIIWYSIYHFTYKLLYFDRVYMRICCIF